MFKYISYIAILSQYSACSDCDYCFCSNCSFFLRDIEACITALEMGY